MDTLASGTTLGRLLLVSIVVVVEHYGLRMEGSDRRKHACFRLGFFLIAAAEAILFLGVGVGRDMGARVELFLWLMYYPLWIGGLLFLFKAFAARPEEGRTVILDQDLRSTALTAAIVLAIGLLVAITYHPPSGDAGFRDLGLRNVLWMVAELSVLMVLELRVLNRPQFFTSSGVLKLFAGGCALLMVGCATRYFYAAEEPLRLIALALLLGAAVRDLLAERETKRSQEVSEKEQELQLLHQIATRLKSTFQLEDLFDILLQNLVQDLNAEAGGVFVREGDSFAAKAIQGAFPPPIHVPDYAVTRQRFLHEFLMRTPIPISAGILGQVGLTGQPVTISNAHESDVVDQTVRDLIEIQSLMAFPLLIEDEVYGVIQLVNRRDGAAFSAKDHEFMQLVVEQAALAIHNARLHREMIEKQRTEHELGLARDIQLKLIPNELPQVEGLDVGAVYRAARQIGGDYYDFYVIDDRHLGIAIADVAGKGVPGALVMIMTRTILKMLAANHLSTAHIISEINEAIAPELQQGMFVTALYVILDLKERSIRMSSAGHNPMILWRAGSDRCQFLKPKGMALGFATGPKFYSLVEEQTVTLEPGDRVFLYTDGVTEAMNQRMEEFGEKRLEEFLVSCNGVASQDLLNQLLEDIQDHAAGQPQYDDITMVALRVE